MTEERDGHTEREIAVLSTIVSHDLALAAHFYRMPILYHTRGGCHFEVFVS
jgi:hypothetical protein